MSIRNVASLLYSFTPRLAQCSKYYTCVAYMKHIVLYHWSLCACIVIGCVIRVYIGSCVATSES